jgi:hypothetical protein
MITNPFLAQYSNTDVANLIATGSVKSNFDNSGNLLIYYSSSLMVNNSITIPIESEMFDPVKVQSSYNVNIQEFPVSTS